MGSSSDDYLLSRDKLSSLRLTAQHYILHRNLGWLIHPTITSSFSQNTTFHIADVACGNGVWSIDVTEDFPKAHITALDISRAMFPPEWTRPSRIQFGLYDVLQPLPDEYVGKFDMVHLSFLIFGLVNKDKSVLMENLTKMLKPGGYIQWQDTTPTVLVPNDPPKSNFRTPSNYGIAMADMLSSLDWMYNRPKLFQDHGLVDVQTMQVTTKPQYLTLSAANVSVALAENARSVEATLPPDQAGPMSVVIKETMAEIEAGRLYSGDVNMVIGRKLPV